MNQLCNAQVVRSSKQVAISAALAELVELVFDDARISQIKPSFQSPSLYKMN